MRHFLLIAALFAGTVADAQENEGRYERAMKDYPPRIGIKAGFNSANITINDAGTVNDRRAVPAWHAGIVADLPLLPVLSIQPALLLNSKGAKYTIGDADGGNYSEVRIRPLYLELPVNAVVKIPLPNKVKLFAGAGPYIAYGLGGKIKTEGKLVGIAFSDEDKIDYGNDDPANGSNGSRYRGNLKRFDAGVNLLAGLEIGHLVLNVGYGLGLMNIRPGSGNDDSKYQNRVASLSVGLML